MVRMIHMAKKNTRKPAKHLGDDIYRLPKQNPYAPHSKSEVVWIWDELQRAGVTPKRLALIKGDGSMDVTMYFIAFGVVANPLHPDNNWRSVVEILKYGKDVYYRLASDIPMAVKDHWTKHGRPPECEWGFFDASTGPAEPGKKTVRYQPVSHHPKNPYKRGKSYIHLVDIIAAAGPRGIDEESWIQACCEAAHKDRELVKNDLTVIKSARPGRPRHRSCREGFVIVERGGRFSIRFD